MLGAEIKRSMQQGAPRIDMMIGGANVFLAPVKAGDGVNAPPNDAVPGPRPFRPVGDRDRRHRRRPQGQGREFTREPTTVRPGTRVCFIRGPQGVSIELLDRTV